MDMTKDIIDYTQKHTEAAERLIVSYQSPVSESGDSEINAASPFHAGKNIVEAKVSITPTVHSSELTPTAMQDQQTEQQSSTQSTDAYDHAPAAEKQFENVTDINTTTTTTSTDRNNSGSPAKIVGAVVSGDITPPPRPFTTSEVVGMSSALDEDADMRIDITPKSRSLPTSPDHHRHSLDSASAEILTRMNAALFEFEQRRGLDASIHMPLTAGMSKLMKPPMGSSTRKPISPMGLKSKKQMAAAAAVASNPQQQQFCLRWNNYQTNLTNVFDELLQNESFVDVTLACEGQSIKAHKMVLSACSPYFQALFYDNPCQHPIIIMRDVRWEELKAIMEFMYKGEINVSQEQINPLLKVAEMLKIRGLAEVSAGGGGHSIFAPHPMVPEQRMTVFDDEAEAESDEEAGNTEDGCQKPKRQRMLDATLGKTLYTHGPGFDLNLSAQRQRKRSRDGAFTATLMPTTANADDVSNSNVANGAAACATTVETADSNAITQPPPVAMTTSTIVRNPFASPNSNNNNNSSATNANQSNSQSSNTASSASSTVDMRRTPTPGNSTPSAPPTPSQITGHPYRPSAGRSSSPPMPSAAGHKGSMSASPAAVHSHSAAAVAAAAALGVNPHHPHHPHHHHHHAAAAAQQFAAQHPLHAAAHSHAAMASALGASLAAGVGTGSGNGGAGASSGSSVGHHDEMEIKPEIAEMIREEERAKMIESGHPWMGGASTSSVTDSYQYQLQSMWQKCWNTNQQNLVQQLRFRERGPLKSWRPEAMAEAIFSVLKEGLSLSQAARKYDIPYPTFVLYANRVHNMLGPSLDGGADPRPKARGRPQRILLGMWPEELIRSVIKAVVFRDYREIKEDMSHVYANGQMQAASPFGAAGNAAVVAAAANGYHNAAKLAAQSAALAPPDSTSPLSTMTETLRRQIMSQQQQSPISQTMNMYKSPAYLQRSEIEDQVSATNAKQHAEARRTSESMPDLSALGLMGIPGLNVMPAQAAQRVSQIHQQSGANYARERERERELKEAMQARQYGNQSRGSVGSAGGGSGSGGGGSGSGGNVAGQKMSGAAAAVAAAAAASDQAAAYAHYKNKEQASNYAFNKRFAETLPPGIDFEAIANGLLQKSVNKSPRFEDFFPSEFFGNAESAASTGAAYPPTRESPLMKIKLEHQPSTEVQNED